MKEAVGSASAVRAFSMILKGNEVDLDQFKDEFKRMMSYMAEQAKK